MNIGGDLWRDPKRHFWLCGIVIPLSPFLSWVLVHYLKLGIFWASGALLVGVIIPIVDRFTGTDRSSPPEEAMAALEDDRFYRWCVYLYLPMQYAGLVFACWVWTTASMGTAERLGLALTVGVVAGVGINAAHELGHKRTRHERRLARIALAQSWYGHFYVEHNHGHHLKVATPDDPASARFGETFWHFLPRSVFGGLRSGWRHESARLNRRGQLRWGLRNDLVLGWLTSLGLFAALVAVFGWQVAPYLVLQAAIGVVLLETANYIEHYGLLRETTPRGRYVRVSPRHSWNSDHVCSNAFLYHLQRHSDHHANPMRRYQTLRSAREAPQLPAGYAAMGLLAYIPPVWRRVIHPRLLAHYDGDVTLVNHGPTRAPLTQRIAGPLRRPARRADSAGVGAAS
ncbi:alkane 1-monooxygenase [Gordonia soli]|uniref:Alkane-1-monooxygenase n=1 Tax=Gordonia soli NBRC 108243 TaxID=1223545 RepID=M0QM11_9ACTN|nr:alkane 1-monooxygenase [Gordonia soli]GAC69618.1 alkane-1-monooxygenase [Gordonia soli NBRC 108243]